MEDNGKLNEINRRALENMGYEVLTAFTLAQARERLSETAENFAEIVALIETSGKITGDIAASSELQSGTITHINSAIEQVAQVVQRNSAAEQQSAAAAQEMSAQSSLLEEMAERFKI